MSKKIIFRVDAAKLTSTGTGSLYRSIFLSKILKAHSFNKLYIFYPSVRTYLAAKLAGIKEVYSYSFLKKKKITSSKGSERIY